MGADKSRSRRISRSILVAMVLVWGTSLMALEPDALLRAIRSPVLRGDAVEIHDVEIQLGTGTFEAQRGLLFPATAIEGRTVEFVFIGQATFHLEAPNGIEAGQLELFTGERVLAAPVEEAVFVLADQAQVSRLLQHSAPRELRPELIDRAEKIRHAWLDDADRRMSGIESSIFKLMVGDEAFQRYFAVWCRSFELGTFVFQMDPDEQEQLTLASFKQLEMTHWQRRRMKHELRVQQRKGRWLDVRVQDLGSWDVWLSDVWSPDQGEAPPGTAGFETEHYKLDVKLRRRGLELEGRARLDLVADSSGRRVVRLELMRDLNVSRVRDGEGRELFFFRSGDEISVLLHEASRSGQRLQLDVDYGGAALEWSGGRMYDLRETSSWHPHCGTVDRATYDVTLRWPKRYEVMAGGELIDSGREGRYRWERRTLDIPAIAFSFAVGRFDIEQVQAGSTRVRVAFHRREGSKVPETIRRATVEHISTALEFYEEIFGPYPLETLTVVTVPRKYSQSFLGYVTLADSLVFSARPLSEGAVWQRRTTIAHELAHQWWGNLVGWWSYRDQWLSEGMAQYMALLHDSRVAEDPGRLAIISAGWRNALSSRTKDGRTIESLGPVTLGNRLSSSRARNGYRTIVYRKGSAVLAMLARAIGEERFLQMLRSLSEAAEGHVLTTESFLKSLERMSGEDLDGFARQYVFGTGIPEVYYGYEMQQSETGWNVQGQARLIYTPHYRFSVIEQPGGFDLRRRIWPRTELGPTTLMVPYVVDLVESTDASVAAPGASKRQVGQLKLESDGEQFAIRTEDRPVAVSLDPRGEILAHFFSEERHPKRFLQYQAEELLAAGDLSAAESTYHTALDLQPEVEKPRRSKKEDPRSRQLTDAESQDLKIRLALVRLYLEQGREAKAVSSLDAIDAEHSERERPPFRVQREALRSRAELRQGATDNALRRLRKLLRPASSHRNLSVGLGFAATTRVSSDRSAMAEAYALLAIAADAEGDDATFGWAAAEARDRGVDLTNLDIHRRSER